MKAKFVYRIEELLDAGEWIEYDIDGDEAIISKVGNCPFKNSLVDQRVATTIVNKLYSTVVDKDKNI